MNASIRAMEEKIETTRYQVSIFVKNLSVLGALGIGFIIPALGINRFFFPRLASVCMLLLLFLIGSLSHSVRHDRPDMVRIRALI